MNESTLAVRKPGRPAGSTIGKHPRKSNGRATVMYQTWQNMVGRCHSEKFHNYKDYGGRGIAVCDRWRIGVVGFDNFCDDMGERPDGLTLGRLDNSKGYGPDNCAWQTWKEQAQDRRPTGVPRDPNSLRGKCREAGLPYLPVYFRIKRLGWSEESALSTPLAKRTRQAQK